MDTVENSHIFNSIDDKISEMQYKLDFHCFKEILESNIVMIPMVLVIEHAIGQSLSRDDLL